MKKSKTICLKLMLFVAMLVTLALSFVLAACGGEDARIEFNAPSAPASGTALLIVDGTPDAALGEEGDVCFSAQSRTLFCKVQNCWEKLDYEDYTLAEDGLTVRYRSGSVGTYSFAEANDECAHSNLGETVVIYEPLCVVPGIGVQYCNDCKASFPVIIPAEPEAHIYHHAVCSFCTRASLDTVRVAFEYGDHTSAAEPAAVTYDVSETVPLEEPSSNEGYSFVYWRVGGSRLPDLRESTQAQELKAYAEKGTVTLTAVWAQSAAPDAQILHVTDDEPMELEAKEPSSAANLSAIETALGESLSFRDVNGDAVEVDAENYTFTLNSIHNGSIYYGEKPSDEGLTAADTTKPVVGSTYLARGTISLNESAPVSYRLRGRNAGEYAFEADVELVVKLRTVRLGTTVNNDKWGSFSEAWYTVEEALDAAAHNSTYNTVYVSGGDSTVRTEFSCLDPALTGYTAREGEEVNYHYTVKGGVTLLLPVAAIDAAYPYTSGTNQEYESNKKATPTAYNMAEKPFSELVIPENVTLTVEQGGTLTVGAITGALTEQNNSIARCVHLNAISGNWSQLILEGKVNSNGAVNAYGEITGNGTVEAMRGSTVLERLEILDWPNTRGAVGRYIGNQTVPISNHLDVKNPNEFPFEHYQPAAISATLIIHYGSNYAGEVRADVSKEDVGGILTLPEQFLFSKITIASQYDLEKESDGEGIFLLKEGSTLIKTINRDAKRFTIEICGDAVGGIVSLILNVFSISFNASSKDVKLPISANLDLVVKNGTLELLHGYEFMGSTEISYFGPGEREGSASLDGATLTLENGAHVVMNNADDGIILYEGATITVGKDCSLEVGGRFGGNINGAEGAKLTILPDTERATGYIAGTGSGTRSGFTGIKCSFMCILTNGIIQEELQQSTNKFAPGTYIHNGAYWAL